MTDGFVDGDGEGSDAPLRKGRTQAERREEAERRMLEAAVRLLAEKGFAGLTLNEVGEAAGYSRGLPTHYFGRKDELLAATARYMVDEFTEAVQRAQSEGRTEGLKAVLQGIDFYVKSLIEQPMFMRALFIAFAEATNYPELFPAIVRLSRTSIERFAHQIRLGQEKREICADLDPDIQAMLIICELRGVVAQWIVDPETVNIEQLREACRQSWERNLRA